MYLKQAALKKGIAQDTLTVAKDVPAPESVQQTHPVSDWAAASHSLLTRLPAATTPMNSHRRATLATAPLATAPLATVPLATTAMSAPTPRDEFKKRAGSMHNGPLRIEAKGARLALTTPSRAVPSSANRAHTVHGKGQVDISSIGRLSLAGSHSVGRLSLHMQRNRMHANALSTSPGAGPLRHRDLPNGISPQRNPVMSLLPSFNQTDVDADVDLHINDDDDELHDDLDRDDLTIAELAKVEQDLLRELATRKAAALMVGSSTVPAMEVHTGMADAAVRPPAGVKPDGLRSAASAFQKPSAFQKFQKPSVPSASHQPSAFDKPSDNTPEAPPGPVITAAFRPTSAFKPVVKAVAKATGSAFQPTSAFTSVVKAVPPAPTPLTTDEEEAQLDQELAGLWAKALTGVMVKQTQPFTHWCRVEPGEAVAKSLNEEVHDEPLCLDFTQRAIDINRTVVLVYVAGKMAVRA